MIKRITYLVLGMVCCYGVLLAQQPTLTISPQSVTVDPNDNLSFDVTASNFTDIISLQYSTNWDPAVLEFQSITNLNADALEGLTSSNFGETNTDQGNFTFSWFDNSLNGVTLTDGTVLYTINFTAIGSGTTQVNFSDMPSTIEVINAAEESVGLNTQNASVTVTGDGGGGGGGNMDPLGLIAGSANAENGSTVCVPVSVTNFADITSFQFSINYDPAVLNYSSLQGFNLAGLDANDFMTPPQLSEGQIVVTWQEGMTQSLPNNATLFEVCFDVVGTAPASSNIEFTGNPTPVNVTTEASAGSNVGITTTIGQVTVTDNGGGGGGNNGELIISAGSGSGEVGDIVCVPLTVSNFDDIVSFQFSINYNPSILNFNGLQGLNLQDLDNNDFNTPPASQEGNITVSWLDESIAGVTVSDNTVIAEICFEIVGEGTSSISFSGNPTSIEVTTEASNGQDIGLDPTSGQITGSGGGGGGGGGNNGELIITAGSGSGEVGDIVCVPLTVSNFDDIVSFQFSINYDASILNFNGLQGLNLQDLDNNDFNTPPASQEGNITVSWLDESIAGVTVSDNTVIAEICFEIVGEGTSSISFSGNPTSIEVTTEASNGQDIGLDPTSGQITGTGDGGGGGGGGNNGELIITAGSGSGEVGDIVCVPLTVSQFDDIVSFQFSINYNPSILNFNGLQGLNLQDLDNNDFNTPPASQEGNITVSWLDESIAGVTVPDNTVIAEICFEIVGEGTSSISFSGTPTAIEVTTEASNGQDIGLDPTSGQITGTGDGGGGGGGGGEDMSGCMSNDFTLFVADQEVAPNEEFCIDVIADNFNDIISLQFTLTWNPSILEFTGLQGFGLPDLDENNFGTGGVENGQLTLSWLDESTAGVTIDPCGVIFQVCFRAIGGLGTSTVVNFDNMPTDIEVIDSDENLVVPETNSGTITIDIPDNISVPFNIGDANTEVGQNVCVPVTVSNFNDISDMQFSLAFDASLLSFDEIQVTGNPPGLGLDQFDLSNVGSGQIGVDWLAPGGSATLANNTVIFNVCFNVLGAGPNNSTTVSFSDTPTTQGINNSAGDDVSINGQSGTINIGNGEPVFPLEASHEIVMMNDEACVVVTAQNFDNIIGIQFSINFDPSIIDYANIVLADNLPGLNMTSFNTDNTGNGQITFSWFDGSLEGVTLPDGVVLFTVCFNAIGNDGDMSPFAFTNTPTIIEVLQGEQEVPWNGSDGSVTIGSDCVLTVTGQTTNISCAGLVDGAIDVQLPDCISNASFSWSNGLEPVEDQSGLAAGTYTVTVTSGNQTQIRNFEITNPAEVDIAEVSTTDVACMGENNGSILLSVSGGTGGYTFNWSPGNGMGNPLNNVGAGTYSVTVVDDNGCEDTMGNIVVGEPTSALAVTPNVTDVICGGETTGAITLDVNGGTGTPTFQWSHNLGTGQNQSGLGADTYTVTVTDDNGCTAIESIEVMELNAALSITNVIVTNITSAGNDGAVSVDVGGGTGSYDYMWTGPNGFGAVTQDIDNLSVPGDYTLKLTDASTGCMTTATATVNSELSLSNENTTITQPCFGQNNGSINIMPVGGTEPYTYQWMGPGLNGVTSEDIAGIGAGTYSVTVTDNGGTGDMVTATYTVDENTEIVITVDVVHVTGNMGNDNGEIDLTVSGGVIPYSYSWNNGLPDEQDFTGLTVGTYLVTVTDAIGCQNTLSIEVQFVVNELSISSDAVNITGVSCNGANDGSLSLEITGGVPDYQFTLNGGNPVTAPDGMITFDNLPGGEVTVVITDSEGNMVDTTVIIPEPTAIEIGDTQVFDATDIVACNGGINLVVGGGIVPYTYQWDNGASTQDIGQLCPGTYCVEITDGAGCIVEQCFEVEEFKVDDGGTNLVDPACPGSTTGSIDITVAGGEPDFTFVWTNEAGDVVSMEEDLTGVPEGTYTVVITDAFNRTTTRTFVLTADSELAVTAQVESNHLGFGVRCADSSDGIIRAIPSGSGNYNYMWSNGLGTNAIVTNAPAGEHSVTVTDDAGCEAIATVVVTAPDALNVDISKNDISCNGETDGEMTAFASGGVGGYTYQWSTGSLAPSIFLLEQGNYSVTVTDNNQCQVSDVDAIIEPETLVLSGSSEPITESETGSATVNIFGGTEPYSVMWNVPTEDTTRTLSGITKEGTYLVVVADGGGCTAVEQVIVDIEVDCLDSRPVITPNEDGGDGLNDEFIINCLFNYPENNLEVYNRWGQLVFEMENYDNSWKGTNRRGQLLPEGGYFFVFTYRDLSGQQQQHKGSLTILRQ